eukprot:351594-Chlamydomonas_euryale.AAC.1
MEKGASHPMLPPMLPCCHAAIPCDRPCVNVGAETTGSSRCAQPTFLMLHATQQQRRQREATRGKCKNKK